MFRTEKTMFRPPGDVSQAARILGKNNVCPAPPALRKSPPSTCHTGRTLMSRSQLLVPTLNIVEKV